MAMDINKNYLKIGGDKSFYNFVNGGYKERGIGMY